MRKQHASAVAALCEGGEQCEHCRDDQAGYADVQEDLVFAHGIDSKSTRYRQVAGLARQTRF